MMATAKNRKAGVIIVAGILTFMFAIGANTIYSFQYVCLDSLPQQCFTGYNSLSEIQQMLLNPGLYLMGAAVSIVGTLLWFKNGRVLESKV